MRMRPELHNDLDDIGHQRPQTLPVFPKAARLASAVGIESNRITAVEFSSTDSPVACQSPPPAFSAPISGLLVAMPEGWVVGGCIGSASLGRSLPRSEPQMQDQHGDTQNPGSRSHRIDL